MMFSLLILKEKPLGIIVAGFLRPSRTAMIAFSVLMMLEDHQSKQQQQPCLESVEVDLWLGRLDSQLDGHEFNSWLPWLLLGWVTIFRWENHLGISPSQSGQLSLLP